MMMFGGKFGLNPAQGGMTGGGGDPSQPPAGSGWGQSAPPNPYGNPASSPDVQPGMGYQQGGNSGYSLGGGDSNTVPTGFNGSGSNGYGYSGRGYDPSQSSVGQVNQPGVVGGGISIDPFPSGNGGGGAVPTDSGWGAGRGGHENNFQAGRMYGNDQAGSFMKPQYQPPQYQQGGGYNNFIGRGFGGGIKRWSGGY
jgi:hypothetical protein